MGIQICDFNCLECIYSDCINDSEATLDERMESKNRDNEVITLLSYIRPETLSFKDSNLTPIEEDQHRQKVPCKDVIEERRAYSRAYRRSHPEEIKAFNKAYYKKHRDEILRKGRIYKESHREELREKQRVYSALNKDKIRDKNKAYYESHKDEISAKRKEKRQRDKNKDKKPINS